MKLLHWIKKQREQKEGFTLVELIVVLVILAILAALLVPALTGYIEKSKKDQVIAETRSLLTAVQTEMSELYAADTLGKTTSLYALASKTVKNPLPPDQNMADHLSDEALMENYYKIVSLSEVPSLLKNGKGQFVCFVDGSGKVHSIIYDSGRGYTGCYFSETNDITAYKPVGTNNYFPIFSCTVVKQAHTSNDSSAKFLWSRDYMLYYAGCTDSYQP